MSLVYFTGLALLIVVGYLFGRSRAAAAAADRRAAFAPDLSRRFRRHRRARADAADLRRRAFRSPTGSSRRRRSPLSIPPSSTTRCAAAPCCATSRPWPPASYSGDADAGACAVPPTPTSSLRSWANSLILGAGLVFGLLGVAFGLRALSAEFRARNQVERFVKVVLFAAAPAWRC